MARRKFVDEEGYDPSPASAVGVTEEPLLEAPIDMATNVAPLESHPPKSVAQLAYERMVDQFDDAEVTFDSWEEMNPMVRKIFEERAESLEHDALFEKCVRQVVENDLRDSVPSNSVIAPVTATNS